MVKSPKIPQNGLYQALQACKKEEEIKAEFCRFFGMKLNALGAIDHYTEAILYEFKYERNFQNLDERAKAIAQTMYYARRLKFSVVKSPLPPNICIADKKSGFLLRTSKFAKFYAEQDDRYDWDRAPSTPCPKLCAAIAKCECCKKLHVYDWTLPEEEKQFIEKIQERRNFTPSLFTDLDKKVITEQNFLEVYDYWEKLFGKYVHNGRKVSEYFFADLEQGKSVLGPNGEVLFDVTGDGNFIRKSVQPTLYQHFWQNFERIPPEEMAMMRQKADRLTEDYRRRFTGEFYTPVEFAAKGLQYLGREIGKEWWKSGEWRFWDMAAGTGNLEFNLPSSALPYCYISTLEEDDTKYCEKIFPGATCFQYDYLNDDVGLLAGQLSYGTKRKMPANLAADLANPKLKWIVFINPPFATANTKSGETGKRSKDNVSKTAIREWMHDEDYGEASRELFTQFLFRISKEFADKDTRLCLFSKLKYITSNNDQKIRDGFFQYVFKRGFIFPSSCFYGSTGDFPVAFFIWDLHKKKHLNAQKIRADVFSANQEKLGLKQIYSIERTAMLNKWCPRPKWDGKSVMPTFVSPFNLMTENKDQRNHIAPGFLCSVSSKGDDFQHQNSAFILAAPYANAGAFSATQENFDRAMVIHTVKRIPQKAWTNDRDSFYAPTAELPQEFVTDCVVWSAFAPSNYAVSLRNIQYQDSVWQIQNQLFPFQLSEIRKWKCGLSDLTLQLSAANEDRFLAKWLKAHALSSEAQALLDAAKELYQVFYEQLCNTQWMDWHIETWDVGIYQVRQALKAAGLANAELAALKSAHDALREKLLPQIYEYGFLNPDVEYFT
ncbi:MAG: hypothetical protein IKS83_04555 [Victivallales bacterium]|nr:hypothetical protein [Victivallales bacterium]